MVTSFRSPSNSCEVQTIGAGAGEPALGGGSAAGVRLDTGCSLAIKCFLKNLPPRSGLTAVRGSDPVEIPTLSSSGLFQQLVSAELHAEVPQLVR